MSSQKPFVLPFTVKVDEQGHETSFPREAEMALLFSMIERRKDAQPTSSLKKIINKLLGKKHEAINIGLIMKVFYPVWVTPWRDEKHMVLDGLGIFTHVLSYDELPDSELFLKDIKETPSIEQHLDILRKHNATFLSFRGSQHLPIIGLVPQENLLSELQAYLSFFREEEVVKAISLKPRISWKQANQTAEMLLNLENDAEEEIKKLVYVKDSLIGQSRIWINQQTETMKLLKEEFTRRVEKEESNSKTVVASLRAEYQSKVTDVEKNTMEEVEKLKKQQSELATELLELERLERERLRKITELKSQREKPGAELKALTARRDKLSIKLAGLEAILNDERMERVKLQGLAEARKGDVKEPVIRKEMVLTERRIKKINESILSINQEIPNLDENRKNLQTILNQLDQQLINLTETVEKLRASKTEKKNNYPSISQQIEDIRRKNDEKLKRIGEEYKLAIKKQELKVKELKAEMVEKLGLHQRTVDELTKRTEEISAQINNLIKHKNTFIKEIHKTTISPPKEMEIKETSLLQIPFYIVSHETSSGIAHSIFPPLVIRFHPRRIFGMKEPSPEPLKTSFDWMLGTKLSETINYDSSLYQEIQNGSSVVNLLQDPATPETLFKGLNQLQLSNGQIQQLKAAFSEYFHQK